MTTYLDPSVTQRPYQQCTRCVMDTTVDPKIVFGESGLCHHCIRYDALINTRVISELAGKQQLESLIKKIKQAGRKRDYDCIIGVSGGVDSTYVAWLVKQYGLRPLAVHLDNGWNSELAVKNIESVLKKLDIDLYTYVLDWEEFRSLQVAFLEASTPDGEIPTDHAIFALLWNEAAKRNIKYIVSGMNFATESMHVPDWSYGHSDWRYIKDINSRFSKKRLRSYPHFSFARLFYINLIKRVRTVSILNYIDYQKETAIQLLNNDLGWQNYGGKHHESIYTRFYQGYVLPRKFGIDKRYAHFSDLINAGQMARDDALTELQNPPYPEEQQLEDLKYVEKKLGMSAGDFQRVMKAPINNFRNFKNSYKFMEKLRKLVNWMRKYGLYPR
jgi:N-acetyl sugar amidotransferase